MDHVALGLLVMVLLWVGFGSLQVLNKIAVAVEALKPSHNTGMDAIALLAEIHQCDQNGVSAEKWESLMDRAHAVVAQQHHT